MTPEPLPTGVPRTTRLDGNAAGGRLSEIFGIDVTDAVVECRHCRTAAMLAEAIVELDADGLVIICRSCEHQLLSYVWAGAVRRVRFQGLAGLQINAD